MWTNDKHVTKMPKVSQNGKIKKKMSSFICLETTSTNWYSGLKQLKMDLNALKCIQIHIPQKMQKNCKKWQQITNNCKISEITKYGEKMTKIDKNVKQCKKMTKMGLKRPKNGKISEI